MEMQLELEEILNHPLSLEDVLLRDPPVVYRPVEWYIYPKEPHERCLEMFKFLPDKERHLASKYSRSAQLIRILSMKDLEFEKWLAKQRQKNFLEKLDQELPVRNHAIDPKTGKKRAGLFGFPNWYEPNKPTESNAREPQ